MQVADITRLVKYKVTQHGQQDKVNNRVALLEHQLEGVAAEIAAELAVRIERPVVTFTRTDVLDAAISAGLEVKLIDNVPCPVDANGADCYDTLHKLMDWTVHHVLTQLPEEKLKVQLGSM